MTRPTGALIYRPFDAPLYYAPVMDPTSPECIMLEYIASELEDIFTANMARRDADAARNGEPRNAYEFYHGREELEHRLIENGERFLDAMSGEKP